LLWSLTAMLTALLWEPPSPEWLVGKAPWVDCTPWKFPSLRVPLGLGALPAGLHPLGAAPWDYPLGEAPLRTAPLGEPPLRVPFWENPCKTAFLGGDSLDINLKKVTACREGTSPWARVGYFSKAQIKKHKVNLSGS